jgi:hypothetical protein
VCGGQCLREWLVLLPNAPTAISCVAHSQIVNLCLRATGILSALGSRRCAFRACRARLLSLADAVVGRTL